MNLQISKQPHSFIWIAVVLVVLGNMLIPANSSRAADELCFAETGYCISGRFRAYWEQNGGLPVFGYPITAARSMTNREDGQSYLTQWFERARFELHPENMQPYDVLLGRLGDDQLRQQGVDWQTRPRATGPQPGCLWFPQTQHNVCNQAAGLGFQSYWHNHGLQDPRLDAYGRSLALFGLPLTEATVEINPTNGQPYLTQWFERARFEWHPSEADPYKVLLGLLGNELYTPPRMISRTIVGEPIAAAGYIFWKDNRTISTAMASNIYGYDIASGQEFALTQQPADRRTLRSDGQYLVWAEARPNGAFRVQGMALAQRQERTVLAERSGSDFSAMALAQGVLYYSDRSPGHQGIFAHTLASGQERMITAEPGQVLASNGQYLIYAQRQGGGAGIPAELALYLLALDGNSRAQLLARDTGELSNVTLTDTYAVWSFLPPAGDERAYLYTISNGTSRPISASAAFYPVAHADLLAWIERPGPTAADPNLWAVRTYSLTTNTLAAPGVIKQAALFRLWALTSQNMLLYTLDNQGIGELYLAPLR